MYMYIYSFKHIAYPTYNSMNFNLFFIPSWIWVELPNALGQISKLFRRFDDNFFFHLGHLDFQKNRFNYCQYDLLSSYGIIEWEIFWKSINPLIKVKDPWINLVNSIKVGAPIPVTLSRLVYFWMSSL